MILIMLFFQLTWWMQDLKVANSLGVTSRKEKLWQKKKYCQLLDDFQFLVSTSRLPRSDYSFPVPSFLSDRMADPIPNRKNSISTQLSFFHLDLFIAPLLSFSLGLRLLIHCLSLPTCRLKVRSYHHLLTERFFTFFSLR